MPIVVLYSAVDTPLTPFLLAEYIRNSSQERTAMTEDNRLPGNKFCVLSAPTAFIMLLFCASIALFVCLGMLLPFPAFATGGNTCTKTNGGSCPSNNTSCSPPTDRTGKTTGGTP